VVTVAEAVRDGTERLQGAGVPDPSWSAERLVACVLGCSRAETLILGPSSLSPAQEQRYQALLEARASRRPLQHLTGTQAFWRHEFRVTPDVLIPRPETEILVEASLRLLKDVECPTVVDVGTGSGCIAISLASERKDATVHAVDVSPAALEVAKANAERLGSRVVFHLGDLLRPVEALGGLLDLVASNPPYVDSAAADALAPEVRDHEPKLALFSPQSDRFAIYRRLARDSKRLLRPGGSLVLEVGLGMDVEVARLCESAGFRIHEILLDLQGIPRTVVSRLPLLSGSP
jgi:release factor glutamine methyltransferase